jgi:nucleoside phosphorylase
VALTVLPVVLVGLIVIAALATPACPRSEGRPTPSPGIRLQPPEPSSREPWAVIFTALGVEYKAIKEHLAGPVLQIEERGTLYEVGVLPGFHGAWRVAIVQTGPGATPAGVQLERAISVFRPKIALFVGVAGGRKDVVRGDVVVADAIYDCEWGKSTLEGYQPRMRTHHPAYHLLQRAHLVARENRWQRRILPACPEAPPASYVKPIVTGSKVIAHARSEAAHVLDMHASDALAVETEGHGFLEGAYVNREVDALVVRGISDLLTGKDEASDDFWQRAASRHAAAFAVEFLDSIGADRAGHRRQVSHHTSSLRHRP